jgi:hypothetical protein
MIENTEYWFNQILWSSYIRREGGKSQILRFLLRGQYVM